MTIESIERAVAECERFLAAVRGLQVYSYNPSSFEYDYREWSGRDPIYCNLYPVKATGAVRRASLDLTRSLAEMRKGREAAE